jgi:dipeptidyl aminopeptidase/acylaminoacyl peptidase
MRPGLTLLLVVGLPLHLAAQAPTLDAPAALLGEGVPSVPMSLVESARPYAEYRSAGLADWHPLRREILIATRFGNATQLHRVTMPGGAREQVTFFPDPVGGGRYQPGKGEFIVFSKDVGGGEFFQLYRLDLGSGRITLLTDGASRNTGLEWSSRGDRIAYQSTRRTGDNTDIWIMDPLDRSTDHLEFEVSGGGWNVNDWSPDDRSLAVINSISANESQLWLFDLASGGRRLLTAADSGQPVHYGSATFGRDGRGIFCVTDRGSEASRLAYLDLATLGIRFLTPEARWEVESLELSPDGRTLAYITNENGIGRLHLLAAATGRELPVPALPVGLIGGLRWHSSSRELGFTLTTASQPADVYSIEPATRRLTRWTRSETGGLDLSDLPEPELVEWPSFDGRKIPGFLYRPPRRFTGPRPVMVVIHGGPEGQSRPGFLGRANYYLRELGVAMLLPNIRGSTGYGKAFLAMDNGPRREGAYRDIEALFDWIGTRPDLDRSRVLVTGGSYGGHMTLVTATRYNDRICCSIDVVGMSHLGTFLEHTSGYRRDLRRVEYGDERDSADRTFMDRTAPINHAGNISKPLFVVQGANDPRVPRSEAEQMVATVRGNGTPVWYLLGKDEGHGFAKKANADYQFFASVLFTRRYLLGEAIP